MPSTLQRKAPWQESFSLEELLERLLDLVGQVEQELGLALDLGEGPAQLRRERCRTWWRSRRDGVVARRWNSRPSMNALPSEPRGRLAHSASPLLEGRRGAVRRRLESVAELADEPHVVAFDGQVRGVHLDQLPDEDPRAGVCLVLEAVDVGDRGADEVVHELELAPDRHAEFFELALVGNRAEMR